jgi:hypothetical protein
MAKPSDWNDPVQRKATNRFGPQPLPTVAGHFLIALDNCIRRADVRSIIGQWSFNNEIPRQHQGGNMPTLQAPKQIVFIVSLLIAIAAWLTVFFGFPYLGQHPSVLLTLAYIILAVGCFL